MRPALALALCLAAVAASAQGDAVRQARASDVEGALGGDALAEAAREFEAAVAAGDPDSLAAHYDLDGYLDRVLDGFDAAFAEGARRGARRADSFPQQLAGVVAWGGSYRFLRVVQREGEARARFRLVDGGGGVSYHDLLLRRAPDGAVRFVDAYNFLGGEDVSQTSRRILAGFEEAADGTAPPSERPARVAALAAAAQRGDHWAVVEAYPRIEDRAVDRKPLLVLYLLAAAQTSPVDYDKALALFQRDYADDPAADLVLIDRHALRGDMAAVLGAVDRLDAAVGGDPYLDALRVQALLAMGRTDEAQAAADRFADALPDLNDGLFLQIDVALAREDYRAAVAAMLRLQREFEIEFYPEDLKRDPLWAGFVASPQYKVWAAERRR